MLIDIMLNVETLSLAVTDAVQQILQKTFASILKSFKLLYSGRLSLTKVTHIGINGFGKSSTSLTMLRNRIAS